MRLTKQGTPTMGGLIILSATIIPTLLFAKLSNVYILLLLITTVWLGTIGFIADPDHQPFALRFALPF